ncbi:hypothetical protein LA345_23360 [Burkholderia vietnamiensis]|nr:hypothetical protein [Burkholderia vietnamiensis]
MIQAEIKLLKNELPKLGYTITKADGYFSKKVEYTATNTKNEKEYFKFAPSDSRSIQSIIDDELNASAREQIEIEKFEQYINRKIVNTYEIRVNGNVSLDEYWSMCVEQYRKNIETHTAIRQSSLKIVADLMTLINHPVKEQAVEN